MKVFGLILAVVVTACGFGGSASAVRIMNGLTPEGLKEIAVAEAHCEKLRDCNGR